MYSLFSILLKCQPLGRSSSFLPRFGGLNRTAFAPFENGASIILWCRRTFMTTPSNKNNEATTALLNGSTRDFKRESQRNRKLRFRKSDKRHRAEKWISACSV
jgi:hypothetical protein